MNKALRERHKKQCVLTAGPVSLAGFKSKRGMERKMKRKTVAYAYVGTWCNRELGWCLPTAVSSLDTIKRPRQPEATISTAPGERAVLCKITIEEVPGRRGRKFK